MRKEKRISCYLVFYLKISIHLELLNNIVEKFSLDLTLFYWVTLQQIRPLNMG